MRQLKLFCHLLGSCLGLRCALRSKVCLRHGALPHARQLVRQLSAIVLQSQERPDQDCKMLQSPPLQADRHLKSQAWQTPLLADLSGMQCKGTEEMACNEDGVE